MLSYLKFSAFSSLELTVGARKLYCDVLVMPSNASIKLRFPSSEVENKEAKGAIYLLFVLFINTALS